MAVIAPQTDVYLLKVPLEIDNTNQLTFANATAQFNYFNSLPKIGYDNFTYQRKDGVLRIPALIDDIIQYNYVMYRNEGFSNKWFYAYIDKMEYMNDNMTAVSIVTDVWQTWQFDLTYKPTFIEREHVNDDTVGVHTLPEGLELGEYEIVGLRNIPLYERPQGESYEAWVPCFCVTRFPDDVANLGDDGNVKNSGGLIGGVFNSLHFFATNTIAAARHIIDAYEDAGSGTTSDAIKNIYMIPRCCVNAPNSGNTTLHGYPLYAVYNYFISDSETEGAPSTLAENYTPVNKKLLTYPFSYFYVTNKAGEDVTYHYEDFPLVNGVRTMTFERAIVPSTSLSAKVYFKNYKSYATGTAYGTYMYNYGVNFPKVPVCAWDTDYYTNWLTQNGVNVGVQAATGIISGGLALGASVATGNPAGLIGGANSLLGTIGSTIGEIHKAETTPPQAHGDINTGDFTYCFTRCSISMYKMSIRPEVARVIDKYFSMFGYKVNSVKIPNITGRRNWNYVKTDGCYIEADIPQDDLQAIKDMFNNGVTFWHNASTFADYSQNNDII